MNPLQLITIPVLFAAVLGLNGCQRRSEAAANETPAATAAVQLSGKTAADSDSVELDETMLPNLKIEQVRQQVLPRLLTATGKVQFNEDQTARILAPLSGQVLDLNVRAGDAVTRDQVLFTIKSREVASLVTDYLQAGRDQDLALKTYNMTRDLFEHQAASRIAFQQADADLTKTKVQVARAEEALRILGLDPRQVTEVSGLQSRAPVRSPLSGSVIERSVTAGQFVQADSTPLLTVANLDSVWVLLDVFERDVHLVQTGQRVQVTATAYPERRFTAKVDRISNRVDPESRTLKVRLLVSNPGILLKPEMFVTASLVLKESTPGITVSAKALFTEGEHGYAFVAVGARRFERREVDASPDGEGRLRVSSGLRAGDRVVADGAILLRLRQQQRQQLN